MYSFLGKGLINWIHFFIATHSGVFKSEECEKGNLFRIVIDTAGVSSLGSWGTSPFLEIIEIFVPKIFMLPIRTILNNKNNSFTPITST